MDYETILRRATTHIWKNKMLWILGFLASFAGGGVGANINFNTSSPDFSANFPGADFGRWSENISAVFPLIALVCCLFLLVSIVLYFVGLAARGGLITAISKIDRGEEITFGESMGIGRQTMFKAFLMRLLLNLPIILTILVALVVGVAVMLPVSITTTTTSNDITEIGGSLLSGLLPFLACLTPLICVLWIYSIIVQFVEAYAYRGYVLSEMGLMEGIRHGWAIFRANLQSSLILGVLVTVATGIFSILVLIIMLPIVLTAVVPFVVMTMRSENPNFVVAIVYLGVIGLGLIILLALLGSAITAWKSAVFTLAYESFYGGITSLKEKSPDSLGYAPFSGL